MDAKNMLEKIKTDRIGVILKTFSLTCCKMSFVTFRNHISSLCCYNFANKRLLLCQKGVKRS